MKTTSLGSVPGTLHCRLSRLLAAALMASLAFFLPCLAYTESKQAPITADGQVSTFGFSQLPPAAEDLTVTVTLVGDYDSSTEYADVTIEAVPAFRHQGSAIPCNPKGGAVSVTVAAAAINSDHRLTVVVDNSAAVSASECPGGRITVGIRYSSRELIMTTFICASEFPGYGAALPLFFQVQNLGADPVGEFRVRFYYSVEEGTGTLFSLNSLSYPGLGGGAATENLQLSGYLPREVRNGTGYIHYFVDAGEVVPEASEANNRGQRPILITGRPDLRVDALEPPSLLAPGEMLTLTYIVSNDGPSQSDPTVLKVYHSTDAEITPSDTLLASRPVDAINAQWFESAMGGTVDIILPTHVPEGPGFLAMMIDPDDGIDESDETNNVRPFAIDLVTPRPDFDLSVWTHPWWWVSGHPDPVRFDLTLTNTGTARSNDCLVEIHYSPEPGIPGTLVGKLAFNALDPGESSPLKSTEIVTPSTVLQGTGYWVLLIDSDDQNEEVDETNNLISEEFPFEDPPVIGFTEFSRVPANADAGGPITLLVRVGNSGATMKPAPMELRILVSEDGLPDNKDPVFTSLTVPALPAHASYPPAGEDPLSIEIVLPSDMSSGPWHFGGLLIDAGEDPPDSFAGSFQLTLPYPDKPRISEIDMRTGPSGREVDLRIRNTWWSWTYRIEYCIPAGSGPWVWIEVPGATFNGTDTWASIIWTDSGDPERDLDAIPAMFYRVVPVGPK